MKSLDMKIKLNQLLGLFPILAFALVIAFSSCNDKDDDPITTKIFGTITIDNIDTWATWVDSGEVQLTIFPEFSLDPPAGWGAVPDGYFGPGVPGGTFALGAPYNAQNPFILEYSPGISGFDYEIEMDPGTYSALAIGFRHDFINDASKRTATLGVYHGKPNEVSHGVVLKVDVGGGMIIPIFDYPAPSTFTINAGDNLELNFRADFDFVNSWYQ
jgi:hypothetical protein